MDALKNVVRIGAYATAVGVGAALSVDAFNTIADLTTYNSLGALAGVATFWTVSLGGSYLARQGIDAIFP